MWSWLSEWLLLVFAIGFRWSVSCACCGGEPCEHCQEDTTPSSVTVEFSGVADDSCPNGASKCSDNYNGTFSLLQSESFECRWNTFICSERCAVDSLVLEFLPFVGGIVDLDLALNECNTTGSAQFTKSSVTTPFDCNFTNEDVPFNTQNSASNRDCDFAGATCTLNP